MNGITAQELRKALHYDPETGHFTRLASKYQPYRIGEKAGSRTNLGYWRVFIEKKAYSAHRLAWLYMTGEWPRGHVDHIDGNRSNNRFSNLRDVDRFTNLQNVHAANKNSGSRFRGVCAHQGKFLMQIMLYRKQIRVAGFDTEEDAHRCYLAFKKHADHFRPIT